MICVLLISACPPNCDVCTAAGACLYCDNYSYLYSGLCVSSCGVGVIASPYAPLTSIAGRQCSSMLGIASNDLYLIIAIAWTGLPSVSGFLFHTSVSSSEICGAIGFTYSATLGLPARTNSTTRVCKIWLPNGVLTTVDSSSSCIVTEPYVSNITCSTTCPSNCASCTTSSACTSCYNSNFLAANGSCVPAGKCGTGYYSPPAGNVTNGLTCQGGCK